LARLVVKAKTCEAKARTFDSEAKTKARTFEAKDY
jgi:hypothetical protein